MANYLYRCICCNEEKEVSHPMNECDDPSPATLAEITCYCGKVMKRVPQPISFNGFDMLPKDVKSQKLAKRSKEHGNKSGVEELKHEKNKEIKNNLP